MMLLAGLTSVDGSDDIETAVKNAVRGNLTSMEGEDLEQMYRIAR